LDILEIALAEQLAAAQHPEIEIPPTPDEPEWLSGNQRTLREVGAPPVYLQREWYSLEGFRRVVERSLREYMEIKEPDFALLIPAPAGSGKTYAGVRFAHWVYTNTQHRVLYAGPRKDFFDDIIEATQEQGQDTDRWYKWLTRQRDDNVIELHTCEYPDQINSWMAKGYKAKDFCEGVCHWDYINNSCPYHKQKKRREPLIYGNHLHLINGHPLMDQFAVAILDESPLNFMIDETVVPVDKIYVPLLEYESSVSVLLKAMQEACESKQYLSGRKLIDYLGMEVVKHACGEFQAFDQDSVKLYINNAEDAWKVPQNFLPEFFVTLRRELEAYLAGTDEYLERIKLHPGGLKILGRKRLNEKVPKHLICFDATGSELMYRRLLDRPVQILDANIDPLGKIYQIWNRSNSLGSLRESEKDEEGNTLLDEDGKATYKATKAAEQLKHQVDFIASKYKSTAVITHNKMEYLFDEYQTGHFYGNRGTNEFKDYECLVVAGAPMVPTSEIVRLATALNPERMRPFDTAFYQTERRYDYVDADGKSYAYPVYQFADPELNTYLHEIREAELIQTVNRVRILFREEAIVYMLTNIPVPDLPIHQLLSIQELYEAPDGVNVFKWAEVIAFIESRDSVTHHDITTEFSISKPTAIKYMEIFVQSKKWEWVETIRRVGSRGPLTKTIARTSD